jgi:hypothetical protein
VEEEGVQPSRCPKSSQAKESHDTKSSVRLREEGHRDIKGKGSLCQRRWGTGEPSRKNVYEPHLRNLGVKS